MFFLLDKKEPKNQDCQEKLRNSTSRFTEILKLITPWRDSDSQNFCRFAQQNLK